MNLDSYICELCSLLVEETSQDLFLDCPFAKMCWGIINPNVLMNCSSQKLLPFSKTSSTHNFNFQKPDVLRDAAARRKT